MTLTFWKSPEFLDLSDCFVMIRFRSHILGDTPQEVCVFLIVFQVGHYVRLSTHDAKSEHLVKAVTSRSLHCNTVFILNY